MIAMLAGCGYKIRGGQTALPEGVKSIAVIPFENRALDPEVGVVMAAAMQREIYKRHMITLAAPNAADAILQGEVIEISLDPQAYDENGFTTAYRAKMTVSAKLVKDGKTVWRVDRLSREDEIDVGASITNEDVRRRRALEAIAEDLAEQIHIILVEGW